MCRGGRRIARCSVPHIARCIDKVNDLDLLPAPGVLLNDVSRFDTSQDAEFMFQVSELRQILCFASPMLPLLLLLRQFLFSIAVPIDPVSLQ